MININPNLETTSLLIPVATAGYMICRRTAQQIEVWGIDISEHYAIYLNAEGDGIADLIYLGASDFAQIQSDGKGLIPLHP
jgi:hypothetical protein